VAGREAAIAIAKQNGRDAADCGEVDIFTTVCGSSEDEVDVVNRGAELQARTYCEESV
jgi:hypothetical protein